MQKRREIDSGIVLALFRQFLEFSEWRPGIVRIFCYRKLQGCCSCETEVQVIYNLFPSVCFLISEYL